MALVEFFGRLHPIVLHLPIGILALAFLMEWMSRKEKYAHLSPAVSIAIQLGMWTAIATAISGYILSLEGGYDETILNRHQWLGIGTVVISIVVYFFNKRKNSKAGKKIYFPLFGILMLLMLATGHLGGSLTHGSNFLTEPFSEKKAEVSTTIGNMNDALVFQDLIHPIFKEKCNRCHNESKLKGKLLMSTIDGIKKGGETGPFFNANDIENSLFLKRVHLPLEEKEHMPPKGKKQLSENEIELLEWWVNEGASFDKKVSALNQSKSIKNILTKYTTTENSVFSLQVPNLNKSTLNQLRQSGIPIEEISKEKPFVTVSLRGRKDLDKSTFKNLEKISKQLIELDLSDTNMNDDLLSYLENFPHLQKLFLQKTKVTGKNFDVLDNLKYLTYLNFYETPLGDEAMLHLGQLVGLKNLYLWNTNISPKAIAELKNERPTLNINTGIEKNIFGGAALSAPMIKVENDIFRDSIQVEIDMNFKGVNIHYTLDGSSPDSTSEQYLTPFLLTETADIQAIAYKQGWETSAPSQRTIVRARYQPKDIKLNKKPKDKYKAEGASSLTNFKKGTLEFSAGEWLGFQKEHFIATLDMGEEIEISKISVSALESTGSWIFFPKEIKVTLSKDGKQYISAGKKSIPTATQPEPASMKNFTVGIKKQTARYIKVEVKSNLVNPKWHPAPGEGCWLFVDEIMVE